MIHQENSGVTAARNAGLSIAEGDYVGIVDGDDWIEPDMYGKLAAIAEVQGCDFVQCTMYVDKWNSSSIYQIVEMEQLITAPGRRDDIWNALLDVGVERVIVTGNIQNKLIRREMLKRVCSRLPHDMCHAEDYAVTMMLIADAKQIYVLPQPLYHYVWREDSHCRTKKFSRIMEIIEFCQVAESILAQSGILGKYRHLLEKMIVRELLDVIRSLHIYAGDLPLYRYGEARALRGKKVVLYGAGQIGKDYFFQMKLEDGVCIVAWVDSAFASACGTGHEVRSPAVLDGLSYDYVLVAVKSSATAQEIIGSLVSRGIDRKKILWSTPRLMVE